MWLLLFACYSTEHLPIFSPYSVGHYSTSNASNHQPNVHVFWYLVFFSLHSFTLSRVEIHRNEIWFALFGACADFVYSILGKYWKYFKNKYRLMAENAFKLPMKDNGFKCLNSFAFCVYAGAKLFFVCMSRINNIDQRWKDLTHLHRNGKHLL